MNPQTIWKEAQNRPTLVVHDLESYAPPDVIYRSLLRRGVFKWLAVRRDLIRLKDEWKGQITETLAEIRDAKAEKDWPRLHHLRGRLKALEQCRGQVRALCHSQRWRAPDNDERAMRWLQELEGEYGHDKA